MSGLRQPTTPRSESCIWTSLYTWSFSPGSETAFLKLGCVSVLITLLYSRSEELRTHTKKSYLVRTQSVNVLPLKPGVGQYIAIHAMLTARNFFLAYFYPSSPFTCIFFPEPLPIFFPALAVANTGSCISPQNKKKVTLLDAGSSLECPWNRLKNMTCGMMTCEMNNLERE